MTTISTPTGSNAAAKTGDIVVSGVMKVVEVGVETAAETYFPFLAVPGVKQIFEFVLDELFSMEEKQLALLVTFILIDSQVGGEETDFNKALAALKAAQAKGDVNAILTALKNFQAAAQNLGHADGSATPA